MKEAIVDLVGPEWFDLCLATLAIALPVAIVLLMLFGMGVRLPFVPWPEGHGTDGEKAPAATHASELDAD
jgi:hypothetical protein